MKRILYIIYSSIFYLYSIFPLNKNKTTFIMTHDKSINGNIMCMYKKVKKEQPNHICKFITKSQFNNVNKLKKILEELKFLFVTPYYLATSKTIFLDNVFLPMSYFRFKSEVKVVQLWHGCNTLKKFGQLSTSGLLKKLEKKANSKYTHIIVSSKNMIKLHKQVFGVDEKVIYPLGLPRMDIFFDENKIEDEKNKFYEQFKYLGDKKIILYAPTFRDNSLTSLDDNMDLSDIVNEFPDEYIIINKFHPFVTNKYKDITNNKIIDMSQYEDLTRLLFVADVLVTDYSSIVFDYALLNKPTIFYAYDKEEYENKIRGFYYNYEEYLGKTIVYSKKELLKRIININNKDKCKKDFISRYVDYNDSNSTKRIYNLIYC
ncbi:hypothetical protein EXM65_10765 [Clostridium botulinum]|uniref:CDP-glycerol--glycerophosphate glycerophosphotransferase n=1 Tax=Clostridium botulinum TaxID=1491 RepID=A0A6M0SRQ3_CLOBO|nr:hypothetical protein [Clostridium botulinum]